MAQTQEVSTVGQRTPERLGAGERTRTRPTYIPPTDIYETPDSIVVLAEMPGVAPDGVDITLERRVLTICGRATEQQHKGYQQVYAEYADGDYERVFTLSEDIDRDRISATLKDGVLHLALPKAERAQARKIELKTG
jgi:HSP20 family molecular chaperone IbpA